jgi:uncharacterized protein (DUF58 family)
MWFKNILRPDARRSAADDVPRRRNPAADDAPLFDETFLRRMERLSLQAQRTLRGNPSSGQHPSRHYLPTSVFSDHRPYTPGDDLRYVDWNAYARQNHMLLKLGEAEQDVNVHLLVDCSRSMLWGQPPKWRLARQIAGALGFLAMAHSDRLHVVPFGNAIARPFGPAQGKGRLIEMLQYIEHMAVQERTDLAPVLRSYARSFATGGILVLISDLLDPANLAEVLRACSPPRWQVLVLHLLDPRELRPELQGPLELEDRETGLRLELDLDAETLADYQQRARAWMENLGQACARRGATYTQLATHWPLERKVVPYLRARRMLD